MTALERASVAAQRLVAKFGQPVQLIKPGGLDESTFPPTQGATSTHTVTAFLTGFKALEVDGTNIRSTDQKAIIAGRGLGFAIEVEDKIKHGNKIYSVVSAPQVLQNNGGISDSSDVVIYSVQLRGV